MRDLGKITVAAATTGGGVSGLVEARRVVDETTAAVETAYVDERERERVREKEREREREKDERESGWVRERK